MTYSGEFAMTEQREERRISRRTIAKGAAWAIPAVPLVVATPAYATSAPGPTGKFVGACKQPGGSCDNFTKGFTFVLEIHNPSSIPLYVYPTNNGTLNPTFRVLASSKSGATFTYASASQYIPGTPPTVGGLLPAAFQIAAGQTLRIMIDAGSNQNSGNFSVQGYLGMAWGHTSTPGADPDHTYAPVPTGTCTPVGTCAPAHGQGWFVVPFSIGSFNPCDNVTCLP